MWFSFYPNCHISCFYSLIALVCFPCVPKDCPGCGNLSPASAPHTHRCRSSPTHSPPPSLSSFYPPKLCMDLYSFSSGQGLLLIFSQGSVRIDTSVDVFLLHLWREMYPCPLILSPSWPLRILDFIRCFFSVYWGNHVFFFHFINMILLFILLIFAY